MKTRLVAPTLASRVVLAVIAAALVMGAAAPGLLGARVSPSSLVWGKDDHLSIKSLATLPVTVQVTIDGGEGWVIEGIDSAFPLDPGEEVSLPVTAAGEDEATYTVRMASTERTPGVEATALVLNGRLRHATFWEALDLTPVYLALALILALGIVLLALRWARRHLVIGIR